MTMAWAIDKNTSAISMHRGDTGAYWVTVARENGEPFTAGDVALYTVKSGATVKISREFPLDDDEGAGNGRFLIAFRNSDTDTWEAGAYQTEIRIAVNPKRNSRVNMTVSGDNITATIDEETLFSYVTDDVNTVTLSYTTEWSASPALYGITVSGTPADGDSITVSYNRNADGEVVDGDTIRTIAASKSTITIMDVLKEV